MKPFTITLLLSFLSLSVFTQNKKDLQDINIQVWSNFTKAFETLDYKLFSDLHSEGLIRIGGDYKTVRDKISYIEGYEQRWKGKPIDQTISFRFLERIVKDGKASERGIYKLTQHPDSHNKKVYYGKFHVILKKEDSLWKILVDYDSSENNTINEAIYQQAFPMDDLNKY
ncbi:nuclear transport factor 2 family protein [Tamlana sp. 2201CG12-4]|uniref:nuclear transport factor 2 family protein n=1 Tax=Tamlana sp. 2201CG12-4 TaxID=3112582 RepID=UPI002DBFE6FD|nr:nuclear transport factor 2 family protein [Tamlana sp. 2201CG12-4]MEC3907692.1 nuclear transport factor 2 family protein [Tamlana sp. 2201CG12-4]